MLVWAFFGVTPGREDSGSGWYNTTTTLSFVCFCCIGLAGQDCALKPYIHGKAMARRWGSVKVFRYPQPLGEGSQTPKESIRRRAIHTHTHTMGWWFARLSLSGNLNGKLLLNLSYTYEAAVSCVPPATMTSRKRWTKVRFPVFSCGLSLFFFFPFLCMCLVVLTSSSRTLRPCRYVSRERSCLFRPRCTRNVSHELMPCTKCGRWRSERNCLYVIYE